MYTFTLLSLLLACGDGRESPSFCGGGGGRKARDVVAFRREGADGQLGRTAHLTDPIVLVGSPPRPTAQ